METPYYRIDPGIFARFPGYVRGVVIAYDINNGPSPAELLHALREAEAGVRAQLDPETISQHPHIKAWRDAYRSFGAKPSEYRSSVEAMARRILRGDLLPAINALVDLGNVISLRYLLSAGGHAIDVVTGNLELRFATGIETFVPFGSHETEHPLPGEVIFTEGDTVLTRRWTWRQANHTLLSPQTTAVEFNLDGLPPVTSATVSEACAELATLIHRYCGGSTRTELLTASQPCISLAR